MTPPLTPQDAALIAEACSKSDLIWVRPPGTPRHRAVWHVWHDDAVCLITGGGEQELPPLGPGTEVIARSKESEARLVTFEAVTEQLAPGTPEWDAAAFALAAGRLNARDPRGQKARWAADGTVWLLRPAGLHAAGAGADDAPAGAAPVPRTAGTTLGAQPFHLGGRLRRARRRG